ncbi:MAG: hypothetical protein R2731_02580 [Nocardioides sp.]
MLNYFNTTGVDFVAAGGTCTYYYDRAGDPVTDPEPATPTVPVVRPRRRTWSASRTRSWRPSTPWMPTWSRWRKSRTR